MLCLKLLPVENPSPGETRLFFGGFYIMPMLECCNRKIKPTKVVALFPIDGYENRTILIGRCPNCKTLRVQLIEYDIINDKWVFDRNKPRRIKNIQEWADKIERESASFIPTKKIKYGNRSNMAFIYFTNKEVKNKNIHIGIDWNGTERYKYSAPSNSHFYQSS